MNLMHNGEEAKEEQDKVRLWTEMERQQAGPRVCSLLLQRGKRLRLKA